MLKNFMLKLKESFFAVFPITAIIFAFFLFVIPTENDDIIKLSISFVLLLLGMALFNMGADNSMVELGEGAGSSLSKSKKLFLMLICSFAIGFIITFAEPDLSVLANQVAEFSSLNSSWVFIIIVSLGVGISMLLAILRLVLKWKLSYILAIVYLIVFAMSFFIPEQFVPIAFDSGSVTTGPISVPFLITFGLGLCAVRGGKNEEDGFGLIALCSAGPILAVMTMGLFLQGSNVTGTKIIEEISIWQEFAQTFVKYIKDVALTILPIVVLFVIFQIFALKYSKYKVIKMCIGFFITYIGIVLFLTGVECGYLSAGTIIGKYLSTINSKWLVILFGGFLGIFSVLAEPALHVLKKQVEDITGGVIKQKVIVICMSLGVAASVSVSVCYVLFSFNIVYVLLPVYITCIALSFVNTSLFTAVAFDSGGVATGAMAVSFILPLIIALDGSGSGFGTVALIAIFPVLTMQILGFIYKMSLLKMHKENTTKVEKIKIIEYDYDWSFEED